VTGGVPIGCAGCAVHKDLRHSGALHRLGRNFLRIKKYKLWNCRKFWNNEIH